MFVLQILHTLGERHLHSLHPLLESVEGGGAVADLSADVEKRLQQRLHSTLHTQVMIGCTSSRLGKAGRLINSYKMTQSKIVKLDARI